MTVNASRKWLYLGLSILLMITYGTVYSWSVFRVSVEDFFDIGSTSSGLPYMTFLLIYALSMLLAGRFTSKYKPNVVLIIGGILICIGWLLSSLSTSMTMLTLTYGFIIGSGVGISYGVPIYVIAKWFPNRKGMFVGIVLAGFGVSPLITAPVGHWMIGEFGLMSTFRYFGIIFGLLIPLLAIWIRLPKVDTSLTAELSKETVIDNAIPMLKTKSFKYAYGCFLIGTLIGLTIIGLTYNVGIQLVGLNKHTIAIMMTIFALFNGGGRPLFGWITQTYGPKKSMRVSYGLIIIASLTMLMLGSGNSVVYLIVFTILWMNLGAWLAIAPIMTMSLYGMKSYNENYGLMFTAYGGGAVIGVLGTGLLIDLLASFQLVFIFIILLAVVGIFLSGFVEQGTR